jgi:hypothetical protein
MDEDRSNDGPADMGQAWDRPDPASAAEATQPVTQSLPPVSGARASKGVAVWVFVLVTLVGVVIAGGGAYLLARGGVSALELQLAGLKAQTAELEAQVVTLEAIIASAEATKAAALSAASAEEPPVPPPAKAVKQFTFIRKLTGSTSAGWTLVADYAQFLTGTAAAAAAAAHGDESPPPNDYYIVNDNPKLRTFKLASPVSITVLGWGGTDSTARKSITASQLAGVLPPASTDAQYAEAPYWITITGSEITKIEQIFLP